MNAVAVTYNGTFFTGIVRRVFPTMEAAVLWSRMCGAVTRCHFQPGVIFREHFYPITRQPKFKD